MRSLVLILGVLLILAVIQVACKNLFDNVQYGFDAETRRGGVDLSGDKFSVGVSGGRGKPEYRATYRDNIGDNGFIQVGVSSYGSKPSFSLGGGFKF